MTRQQQITGFQTAIQATTVALQALSERLDEEFAALSSTDPQKLEEVLPGKQTALSTLEATLKIQEQIQVSLGLPRGLPPIDDVLQHFGVENLQFRQAWEQLRELSTKTEQQNNRNGRLVHQGQQTTQEALAIMTGRRHTASTYSQQGRSALSHSSHSIAKA